MATLSNEEFSELHDAVLTIHDHPRVNPYARAYTGAFIGGHYDKVQLLYILNNITHLRDGKGERRVKDARDIIKKYSQCRQELV
jgi:hypothetical protein